MPSQRYALCSRPPSILEPGNCTLCRAPGPKAPSNWQDTLDRNRSVKDRTGACPIETGVCGPYRFIHARTSQENIFTYFDAQGKWIADQFSGANLGTCAGRARVSWTHRGRYLTCTPGAVQPECTTKSAIKKR